LSIIYYHIFKVVTFDPIFINLQQSKVKESLAVLKPHFNHESPVTAIATIQGLEVLGTMDLNAPLRDETLPQQEELPSPQPPVQ